MRDNLALRLMRDFADGHLVLIALVRVGVHDANVKALLCRAECGCVSAVVLPVSEEAVERDSEEDNGEERAHYGVARQQRNVDVGNTQGTQVADVAREAGVQVGEGW